MCTTNGTRAIYAARQADQMVIGALTNADAVAEYLVQQQLDVTLLCAGTNGEVAMEDLLGAGAVIEGLLRRRAIQYDSDTAMIARALFDACRHDLAGFLRRTQGGRNVVHAGLGEDIAFAAQLNSSRTVPVVLPDPLRVIDPSRNERASAYVL
jgi:2-phosphosulfolactate phosphatase